MNVKILGCSGAIGGPRLRTTSILVDEDILVDAGTGVGELDLAQLARIDHVFLTHSHLDHIAYLPLMLDAVSDLRDTPVTVYVTQATRDILCAHIFNWLIWPDFTAIPDADHPVLRFQTVREGETINLGDRRITALPAEHTVPAVGYLLDSGTASLAFTGDTTVNDRFWHAINDIKNLHYLVIETAFSDNEQKLAALSKHLCPGMLRDELKKLKGAPQIFITHLKPGQADMTMREIAAITAEYDLRMLEPDYVFSF